MQSLFKISAIFLFIAFSFTLKAEILTLQNVTATVQPVGAGVFEIRFEFSLPKLPPQET